MTEGVSTELDKLVCEDYSEDEITADKNAIDWDIAYELVQKVEEEVRQAQLKLIQEQERARISQEFEAKQKEEQEKGDKRMEELLQK